MGQTIVDSFDFYHKESNSTILTTVNTNLFWIDFLTVILDAPKNIISNDLKIQQLGN